MSRHFTTVSPTRIETQLMGRGDWSTLLTTAGSGYTQWRGLAVGRWHEDPVADDWGSYLLLRDVASGEIGSATLQPVAQAPDAYEVIFDQHQARYTRRKGTLLSTLHVHPNAEGDGDWRQLTLHNSGSQPRLIDVFSCVELTLGPAAADAAHPAFSKMFVQTAAHDDDQILLAWRRKGAPSEPDICAAHGCVADSAQVEALGFETDRVRFFGRGRSASNPAALDGSAALRGRSGTVLDPLFSLQRRVRLAPGARVTLRFFTVAGAAPDRLLQRARQCLASSTNPAPAADDDGAAASPQLDQLQQLSTPLFYSAAAWRGDAAALLHARGGQPSLWPHGISGDHPLVLVRVSRSAHLSLVHELLAAQQWWHERQLVVDLVVLAGGQDAPVDKGLTEALAPLQARRAAGNDPQAGAGGLFVLQNALLSDLDRAGLAAASRIVLDASHGDLAAQVHRARTLQQAAPALRPPDPPDSTGAPGTSSANAEAAADKLANFNGLGGFDVAGGEYVIRLKGHERTPMPWINVIANADFGFTVSAEGGGYAWAVNSQKHAITPWSNDPVRDAAGDVLYIRDVDDGRLWTATPDPIRAAGSYEIRHGPGYTRFAHSVHGLDCELVQLVPLDQAAKVSRLRLRNGSDRPRRLQLTAYVRWAMGAVGENTAPHVVTWRDEANGALLARNDWCADHVGRVAFADWCGQQEGWTCDRQEFLGVLGTPSSPAALRAGTPLQGRCGAGLDPCAALQTTLELAPGQAREAVFLLGEGADLDAARALVQRLRQADGARQLQAVHAHWQRIFDAVQIKTPDPHMDLMVNRWLPYQVIACRLDARTAFYQASGAWGFRDQLQDVAALTLNAPERVRAHLLRAAGRQFTEGDVQHWWLPPTGAGVRTHIADDRLWLPLVAAHYVAVSGDTAVLDEQVAFLQGKPLAPDRVDDFYTPAPSDQRASLFEHCARAIEASLQTGAHGLPLFGSGDWNDGMNRVGSQGRGESVWMGWFLHASIAALAPLAEARGEHARAAGWRKHAARLRDALQRHAWDGQWWLRGWFDDGTPLGSSSSAECRIDGIAQAWSVISGACDLARARRAMQAVDQLLVNRDAGLVALLTPPFDHDGPDPGYIRGYPPGLRENGGQYTHGSVWSAVAYAQLGDGDRACEVWRMLAPVSHSDSAAGVARWQVEPYVACADVYTAAGHLGRGGWTWYTGTAGWLYRAALESLLGLHVCGDTLRIAPCIARDWPGFSVDLRWRSARYQIHVANPAHVCSGVRELRVDGSKQVRGEPILLQDDGGTHQVQVTLG
ncbi:MAG: hypothetical protein WCZ18_08655 [Ottowia sp.]|nr:hypothetical protein [Ottowia sp.]